MAQNGRHPAVTSIDSVLIMRDLAKLIVMGYADTSSPPRLPASFSPAFSHLFRITGCFGCPYFEMPFYFMKLTLPLIVCAGLHLLLRHEPAGSSAKLNRTYWHVACW